MVCSHNLPKLCGKVDASLLAHCARESAQVPGYAVANLLYHS